MAVIMEINDVLNELFKMHDELSFDCVFNESDILRSNAFDKAEALRELVQRIEDNIKDESFKKIFRDGVREHYKSMSSGIFYKRNIRLKG
jgi:hypothetical protein